MSESAATGLERVRASELIAALSLATDLQLGLDFEHALRSTIVAVRIAERLGVDRQTRSDTYYACLLMYAGCTADIHVRAELFDDIEQAAQKLFPVLFGSQREQLGALARSIAPDRPLFARAAATARGIPKAARRAPQIDLACREVAGLLSERLGLPKSVRSLADTIDERWDGKGEPGVVRGDELPLATRIAHVARDADLQRSIGGGERTTRVLLERSGGAFDPEIVALVADESAEILALGDGSAWLETLECEPDPTLILEGEAIDRALGAIGEFADLASPYFSGHSRGVAELAEATARRCGLSEDECVAVRRAGLVHDVGRTAVPTSIWQKPGPLTPQEWERVRLHAYYSERILSPSAFLSTLAPIASSHHERCDGSGYHRGSSGSGLSAAARVLAAADAFHAMAEPRPHREPLARAAAADALVIEARAGRLDPDAVGAVLEEAGEATPSIERPAGLTKRETEVLDLLAHGLQTKQVAKTLGISIKTADRHIQNAYGKIGVSTRAGATLFAVEHGLVTWGELPIGSRSEGP